MEANGLGVRRLRNRSSAYLTGPMAFHKNAGQAKKDEGRHARTYFIAMQC